MTIGPHSTGLEIPYQIDAATKRDVEYVLVPRSISATCSVACRHFRSVRCGCQPSRPACFGCGQGTAIEPRRPFARRMVWFPRLIECQTAPRADRAQRSGIDSVPALPSGRPDAPSSNLAEQRGDFLRARPARDAKTQARIPALQRRVYGVARRIDPASPLRASIRNSALTSSMSSLTRGAFRFLRQHGSWLQASGDRSDASSPPHHPCRDGCHDQGVRPVYVRMPSIDVCSVAPVPDGAGFTIIQVVRWASIS